MLVPSVSCLGSAYAGKEQQPCHLSRPLLEHWPSVAPYSRGHQAHARVHLPFCPPPQIANLGAAKAAAPFWKTMLLGVVAGCYVALGAALLLTVGPNCMGIAAQNPGLAKYITGAIGFPYALLAILVSGSGGKQPFLAVLSLFSF